jgi:mannosyltransferase
MRRSFGWPWTLAALTAAGAALRFATLSTQSFWLDEAVTHQLVGRSFGGMLGAIPHSESTPPAYYVIAWVWARVFGSSEAGLRSLSALVGTATIVVLALIARRRGGERAGLAAAALAASSPLLIWYSQEARAYALLVLLCAATVWCLQREDWRGWALAAALALATHYFALFVVGPEVVWLALRRRRSPAPAVAIGFVALVGAALLPLAIVQARGNRASFIHSSSLASRVAQVPKQFLIGYATPHATLLTVIAAVLAVALALQLRRRDRAMVALAAAGLAVPLVLAVAGADYVITRNLITAMIPLVVLAGVAAARTRAGPALVAGICAAGVVAYAGVEGNVAYQRDDWRGVASAIGPIRGPIAVVLEPASGSLPLAIYAPLHVIPPLYATALTTREVDVVDLGRDVAVPAALPPLAGFTPTVERTPEFTLVRYRAPVPTQTTVPAIITLALVHVPGPEIMVGG